MDPEQIRAQLAASLALLEGSRERLERALNDTEDISLQQAKMVNDLAKASVELSKEYRAWAKTSKEVGAKLSLADKLNLMAQAIAKLSETDRRELLGLIGARDGKH